MTHDSAYAIVPDPTTSPDRRQTPGVGVGVAVGPVVLRLVDPLTLGQQGIPGRDGAEVFHRYSSNNGRHDAALSRVTDVKHGLVVVAVYEYNGLATLVGTRLPQADLLYNRFDVSGDLTRIDRFGRVTSDIWTRGISTDQNPATYQVFRDMYDVDVTWDRASNIVRTEDNVYPGWDWDYSLDGRDRLVGAERGDWNGGNGEIDDTAFEELWALSQTGNWLNHKLDLDGSGTYTGAGELDDTGTFNVVNELLARDIDSNSTDDFTLDYDDAGNLIDDGEHYEYVYDAFGRLRVVKARGTTNVVEENRYNGLNHRITWHYDVDDGSGGGPDGTVDSDDPVYVFVYDDRWRIVAVYRDDHTDIDANPKEQFTYHNAGLRGGGGSSYIDSVILRDRDATGEWHEEADSTLEERVYYCQNWRADVVALFTDTGHMIQQVRYDAYGVPFRRGG